MVEQGSSEEYIEYLKELKRAYISVFTSDDGKRVLEHMAKEFDADSIHCGEDTHETSFRLGQRDVLIFIKEKLK